MEHDVSMFLHNSGQEEAEAHLPSVTSRPASALTHLHFTSLVVHGDVAEQVGHGLAIVNTANGFSQYHADIHSLDFWTL